MRSLSAPVLVLLAALGSCASPPRVAQIAPPPAPRPTPAPPPVAPPAPVAANETRVEPGLWTYQVDNRGSRALFGREGNDALLVIRCDRNPHRVFVSVRGSDPDTLTLRATSTVKTFAARPTGATPPYIAVEIAPTDPILDAVAFSRGRFTVAVGARQTALPIWPEFTRVVEDCRA